MAKERLEYRTLCSGAELHTHRRHVYLQSSLDRALQHVIDADHHAEMHPDHFYAKCAPYVIEARTVSKWKRLED